MIKHHIVTIQDETGIDAVDNYLDTLENQSITSLDAKVHRAFIQMALDRLAIGDLNVLCREKTQLDININGQPRTKRYELIKPLGLIPVYELRYGLSANEHLRLLFFPFSYEKMSFYVFTKVVIKTLEPNVDETNKMRDLTYILYKQVMQKPEEYLEVDES